MYRCIIPGMWNTIVYLVFVYASATAVKCTVVLSIGIWNIIIYLVFAYASATVMNCTVVLSIGYTLWLFGCASASDWDYILVL